MWKKICTTVLLMFLVSIAVSAFPLETVEPAETVYTEQSGAASLSAVAEDFAWSLDENGVLTISGHGDMPDEPVWIVLSQKITSVIINDGITSIAPSAFSGCAALTDITIPNSVTTIGDEAFSGCAALTDITIPNSVTTIGDEAFSGCLSLKQIVLPDGLRTIGDAAFASCS